MIGVFTFSGRIGIWSLGMSCGTRIKSLSGDVVDGVKDSKSDMITASWESRCLCNIAVYKVVRPSGYSKKQPLTFF